MTFTYLSVCSGIEAASVAWEPLGWRPWAFSEIEKFPCEVLAAHYGSNMPGEPLAKNGVPNLGDMTKFREWPDATFDLLVGGTPCQSFSVAGLRKGLADPRGNLALVYLAILDRYRPRWFLWENVPGVLSSWSSNVTADDLHEGERREVTESSDFGCFVEAARQLGYSLAWRVLDAQFVRVDGYERAVPQRRERVFVVGHIGDWRRPAAVLFDGAGLRGDPAPRRETGEGIAAPLARGSASGGGYRNDADTTENLIASSGDVSYCRNAGGMGRIDGESETLIACPVAEALTVGANQTSGFAGEFVAHALRADGFDASEDGTGRGTPIVPVAVSPLPWDDEEEDQSPQSPALEFPGLPQASAAPCAPRQEGAGQEATASPRQKGALQQREDLPGSFADDLNALGAQFGDKAGFPIGAVESEGLDIAAVAKGDAASAGVGAIGSSLHHGRDGGGKFGVVDETGHGVSPDRQPAYRTNGPISQALVSFGGQMSTPMWDFDLSQTLQAKNPQAIAFDLRGRNGGAVPEGPHDTANIRAANGGSSRSYVAQEYIGQAILSNQGSGGNQSGYDVDQPHSTLTKESGPNAIGLKTPREWAVRRLTPRECERLQGFPDAYTAITRADGKQAADGPRYKALGNSMAVNCMRWLGQRIQMVEAMDAENH